MRIPVVCVAFLLLGLAGMMGRQQDATCSVTLLLVDAETGDPLPGLLQVLDAEGERLPLPGLLSRGQGLGEDSPLQRWSVVPREVTVQVPQRPVTFRALAGLEFEAGQRQVDLTGKSTAKVDIELQPFARPAQEQWRSGNTHLHLMKLTRAESDRYLREVPRGDGLDLVFVSYLERAIADKDYISNEYSQADLDRLAQECGVLLGNGEEHRHNFAGFGQGYGHVMLLDIEQLVQPVSIGPGIMQMGTDGLPLARGLASARQQGATNLWCHNAWGVERIPSWISGRVDAQNIFDGGVHGSYKDSFYRYLNIGLKVPFSTGTDWFQYDFSRVYAHVDGPLSIERWLTALRSGRTYITNGPLFEFQLGKRGIGEVIALAEPGSLPVRARVRGRTNFERLELIRNGVVIGMAEARSEEGHFVAELQTTVSVDGPAWFALRTPPPPVKDDPELQSPVPANELGQPLFGHTSPIYVEVAGQGVFDRAEAAQMLEEMEQNVQDISANALFADDLEKARVLDVYRDAIELLRKRLQ